MNYDVEWHPTAEGELAAIWLVAGSDLRRAITHAARAIDRWLERDPANQGESRPNDQRIMFEAPLGIIYEMLQDERLVRVLHAWNFKRKSKK